MISAMPRIAIAMHDYPSAVATFSDVFGMPVLDFSDRTVPSLGAHVGMCVPPGGSNIELMAPADPTKALSQAIQKTLDRRGDGLYALMLEAPDPNLEAESLAARSLDVLPLMPGAGGRDVHPRSTHGVLVRVYPDDSAPTKGDHHSSTPGLSGIAKVIIATTDASLAASAYGHGFGLAIDPVTTDTVRGVDVVRCHPPKGGFIELVSPSDTSRPFAQAIESFVKEHNEGMYALVLQADDPEAAGTVLAERGLATTDAVDPDAVVETSLFGTRILIQRRS